MAETRRAYQPRGDLSRHRVNRGREAFTMGPGRTNVVPYSTQGITSKSSTRGPS